MSKLVAATFESEKTAFDLRADLVTMQQDHLLDIDDIVVVTQTEKGKPKLHQAVNLTAAGAISGSWWGMFVGLLFLNPLLGAAVGAASGALGGAISDIGIDDTFMKNVSSELEQGKATVFMLVRDVTQDKVMERLEPYAGKGELLTTSISREDEEKLRSLLESKQEETA